MPLDESLHIDLRGKSVLVTGGSMGIGYAAASACLAAGADVSICARGQDALASASESLQRLHPDRRVVWASADIGEEAGVQHAIFETARALGSIDGVVHAAGVYGPIGSIDEVDSNAWLEAIRINLFGSFLVARHACRYMRERSGGRLVFFSGGGASSPFPNYTGYACGKVAIVRLIESAALEMARYGIEMNALAPGFVATRLHEQTLAAGPERSGPFYDRTVAMLESAVDASLGGRAAAFLISDAAKGITGKFVAAPYDGFSDWPSHLEELREGDLFTLRRILPKDRGLSWQ